MKHLSTKQQKLLAGLLAGKSIREAAEEAELSYSWSRELVCNAEPSTTQKFYDELKRQKEWQIERLLADADRDKEALLDEWEELRNVCREGETKYTNSGHSYKVQDLPTWSKTLVERGKLCGHYITKLELEDTTPEKRKRRDLTKLSRKERLLFAELELKAMVEEDEG